MKKPASINKLPPPPEVLLGTVFQATAEGDRFILAELKEDNGATVDTHGTMMTFPPDTGALSLRNKLVKFVVNQKCKNDIEYVVAVDKLGVMEIADQRTTTYEHDEAVSSDPVRIPSVLPAVPEGVNPWMKAGRFELIPYGKFPLQNSFMENGQLLDIDYVAERAITPADQRRLSDAAPTCDVYATKEGRLLVPVGSKDMYLMDVKPENYGLIVVFPKIEPDQVDGDVSAYIDTAPQEESKSILVN